MSRFSQVLLPWKDVIFPLFTFAYLTITRNVHIARLRKPVPNKGKSLTPQYRRAILV